MWNDEYRKYVQKPFFGGKFYVRPKFSSVRSSHNLCALALGHSLEREHCQHTARLLNVDMVGLTIVLKPKIIRRYGNYCYQTEC